MPEQQETEKKKVKIAKRILKWIGLGLLVFLIIAAAILQAPWKLTILLLIILAACTILPKPFRKWFWLSAGVVVIVLIVWVFLPEDNEGWRPYTFDEELAALQAKYAIPDEENAAVIYNQLLADYDANTFEPNFPDEEQERLTRTEPWLNKDYPELAEWLKGHQSTIETLLEASRKEKCRFPISDTVSMTPQINRNSAIKHWAYLLIRTANNDLAEGRIGQSIEKNLALLQVAKHLCQQPTIIDMLVGFSIEGLANSNLNRFVVTSDPTEAHLSIIEEALNEIKHDWSSDLPRFPEHEKLLEKNTVCSITYQRNPEGKTRLSRDPTAAFKNLYPEEVPPLSFWQKKLIKAFIILGWFGGAPSTPQKVSDIIDTSFERLYRMAEPDFDWKKEPKKFSMSSIKINFCLMTRRTIDMLITTSESTYYTVHDIYLATIAQQKGSQIIIALRRYKNQNGQWPATLEDIKSFAPAEIFVDPINGDSFVYKQTEGNFILYSKGKNNIDEGGKYHGNWPDDAQPDDRLIWPPKSRETKKEKVDAEQH